MKRVWLTGFPSENIQQEEKLHNGLTYWLCSQKDPRTNVVLLLSSCMMVVGELLNLPELQFLHLYYLTDLFKEDHAYEEFIYYLIQSRQAINFSIIIIVSCHQNETVQKVTYWGKACESKLPPDKVTLEWSSQLYHGKKNANRA